jgi:hypothetical protein
MSFTIEINPTSQKASLTIQAQQILTQIDRRLRAAQDRQDHHLYQQLQEERRTIQARLR